MCCSQWRKRVRTVLYCTLKTWKVSPFSRSRTAGPAVYRAMFSVLQHPAPRTQHCSFCAATSISYVTLNIVCPKLEGKARFSIRFVKDSSQLVVFSQIRFSHVSERAGNSSVSNGRDLRWFSPTILSKAFKVREKNFQNPTNWTLSKWISSGSSLSFRTFPGCFFTLKVK